LKKNYYIVVFFLIWSLTPLVSQTEKSVKAIEQDSIPEKNQNTIIEVDSIPLDIVMPPDSLQQNDSLLIDKSSDAPRYKISKDAIEETIKRGSVDSNWVSVKNKEEHLYGDAFIEYENVKIEAPYLIFNFEEKLAIAKVIPDERGRIAKKARFTEGDNEVLFDEMTYKFDTKKAIVKKMKTQESEFFVLGDRAKLVPDDSDTTGNSFQFFIRGSTITSCDLDHPHYGIRASKLKVVPDKLAVLGPSSIDLSGVPLPVLPFGFFPLTGGASSGLIIPQNYDFNRDWGLGLREVGYYFPISDNIDLRVTGDIYTRGTHGIRTLTNYNKRYKYTGSIGLGYSNAYLEDPQTARRVSERAFSVNINHRQDPKAHPYRTIGGSINISSNQFDRRTFNDPTSVLTNTYRSNFNYNYRWPDSPFKISVGMSHNQETQTGIVNLTLPEANVNMNTINPFKRKNPTGDQKWYENITLGYNSSFRNFVRATDTTLLRMETLQNMQSGLQQRANLATNTRVLRYFNVSPFVNYEEVWLMRTQDRIFDPRNVILTDTLGFDPEGIPIIQIDTVFGRIIDTFNNDFKTFRRFESGINVNTQIFGTKRFSKGWLRGVRHIVKPSAGFSYSPGTRDRYIRVIDTSTDPEFNDPFSFNPLMGGAFPVNLTDDQMALNFNIINVFEAKYYSKKDSMEKKFNIFDQIRINGSYNMAADSFKWSDISVSGNHSILRGLTVFNFNARFTPYVIENNRRVNRTLWEDRGRLIDFVNLNGNFNTGLNFGQIRNLLETGSLDGRKTPRRGTDTEEVERKEEEVSKYPKLSTLFDNFRLAHNLSFGINRLPNGRDTFMIQVNSIELSGNLQLTNGWSINVARISYNFKDKALIYPSFGFNKDLHCWSMSFNWFPSRDVYGFFIGVKSSSLSFLKYDYGQQSPGAFFRP
jgi:hypothetical protein